VAKTPRKGDSGGKRSVLKARMRIWRNGISRPWRSALTWLRATPADFRENIRGRYRRLQISWARIWRELWRENIPYLAMMLFGLFAVAAIVVGTVEYMDPEGTKFGDGATALLNVFYWSVITLSTTGYGDYAPATSLGRALTVVFSLLGMGIVAVFTATITSVFTARKIKEGRGLEKIKAVDHVVLCGWSRHLDTILRFLSMADEWRARTFVLINTSPEAQMNEVLYHYGHVDMHFVHGDFLQESVLRRANVEQAAAAIILASVGDADDRQTVDNRTLQTTLAVKELNPEIKVIAEVLEPENEQHLRRANVDDIVVSDEFSGYLLASSTVDNGLHDAMRELLTIGLGNNIVRNPVPENLRGKTFAEVHEWFRSQGALAIGVITEEPGLSLDDMLVDDFSAIDRFIRSAFTAAGKDLTAKGAGKHEVVVNPPDGRIIGPNDDLIVIAEKPIVV
jgi:voltage-gated potassium channel